MSPCPEEELERYARGAQSTEEAERLRAHLSGCPRCAREVAWQRLEQRLISERARRELPHPLELARLRRATLGRIPEAMAAAHRREFKGRAVSAGRALLSAGCAVLAAFAIAYLPHSDAPLPVLDTAAADCMSQEPDAFCPPPTSPHERVAAVEDAFDACLVATPHLGPGAGNFCW